jgi:hypothetical protein
LAVEIDNGLGAAAPNGKIARAQTKKADREVRFF